MERSEYCAVVLENGATRRYTLINYNLDGSVKSEIRSEKGIGPVIAELDRQGWEFAFKDLEGSTAHIFFKRTVR